MWANQPDRIHSRCVWREVIESNEGGPTLLKLGDSLLWVEAGELPAHIKPWVGSVYVYVPNVDIVYARAMELGAHSISAPEDKPYNERQAGFQDVGGNTWWVSTYLGQSSGTRGESPNPSLQPTQAAELKRYVPRIGPE